MNDRDKANLDFLLNADFDTLVDWFNKVSADDVDYAMELMAAAKAELALRIVELDDYVEDVSDAAAVLDKFRI